MRLAVTQPLFAWEALEDNPSLQTVRDLLAIVPDGRLLDALRRSRGHGRDDYPVEALWGVVLLTILLRHPTFDACLGDLRRNAALRRLVGIQREADVPKKWNVSRFLKVLGAEPHLGLLHDVFDTMIRTLGGVVRDLGMHTAGDSTGLRTREEADPDPALPAPAGGRKEYTDETGQVTKVLEWFGYKCHLLVDVRHELAVAYRASSTKRGDNEELPPLVAEAQANLPEGRMKTLAYDKAADDAKVHACLAEAGIEPVIQNRSLWKEESERMLPGHDGRSNIVYDEAGTVHCYDKTSEPPVRHRMAFIGREASRGTLKYRCPAMHEGWRCPNHDRCNAGKKYGKTVRVKQEIDLRRFPPIPRATKQFERLYRGRTAVAKGPASETRRLTGGPTLPARHAAL
ncbi:MAG: transposase [Planctomycetota bacterium]|nr:transposase [Planctomycetota bacterium]